MYTARCAWIQKIRLHLQKNGSNYLTPGGQFHNIQWVIKNYGLVPETVYSGKVGRQINHDHSLLDTALTRFTASLVKQHKKEPTAADWKYINSILDKYLGKIPASFMVEGKQYSPKTYASDYLQLNPDDYIEIMSFTHHPFYKAFIFENKYNFSFDKYMNVPFTDFVTITDSALQNGYTVLWNGDVTDAGFDFAKGAAFLLDTFTNMVNSRQQAFADSSSYMDHLMHIVGLTKDEHGHKWYYIKNSWGTNNALEGYMLMDENYFAIKTAAIVVNKKVIPAAIVKKMNL
jgi:bleomycin hydrolase